MSDFTSVDMNMPNPTYIELQPDTEFGSEQSLQVLGEIVAPCTVQVVCPELTGQYAELIPFEQLLQPQWQQLWDAVSSEPNEACWTYLPYLSFNDAQAFFSAAKSQFQLAGSQHFAVSVKGQCLGWLALLNVRVQLRVLEIGNVYFSHLLKRTSAATEAIYLLLKWSLGQGYRRVEWKCDTLNCASKAAAQRFGFQFEGIFRQDRIVKGRNRDTAWFSMLDHEWSACQSAYETWLHPNNFNALGVQQQRLSDLMQKSKNTLTQMR